METAINVGSMLLLRKHYTNKFKAHLLGVLFFCPLIVFAQGNCLNSNVSDECWDTPCPNDNCVSATEIILNPNCDSSPIYRFCNCNCTFGNFWEYEQQNFPYVETQGCPQYGNGQNSICAYENFDFWVKLVVTIPGIYTILMESDYVSCAYLEQDGVQFFLYDVNTPCNQIAYCDGGIGQTPLLVGYPCLSTPDPGLQSFGFTVDFISVGYYYLQIDGWEDSKGCLDLTICSPGVLSILDFQINKNQEGYPVFDVFSSSSYVIERSTTLDDWHEVSNPDETLVNTGVYYYRVVFAHGITTVKSFFYLEKEDWYWNNHYDVIGRKIK